MVRPQVRLEPADRASNRFQQQRAPRRRRRGCRAASSTACARTCGRPASSCTWSRIVRARCPDAVFPNNWVSFHADGTLVLYPMLAPNRRLERRRTCGTARRAGGFRDRHVCSTSHITSRGRYLEGTGSVVFDHAARSRSLPLAAHGSPPCSTSCAEIGYRRRAFDADRCVGVPIYHTNVMLSIGTALRRRVRSRRSPSDDRAARARRVADGPRRDHHRSRSSHAFAGNVLELRATDGAPCSRLSRAATTRFGDRSATQLQRHVDGFVTRADPDDRDARRRLRALHARRGLPAARGTGAVADDARGVCDDRRW